MKNKKIVVCLIVFLLIIFTICIVDIISKDKNNGINQKIKDIVIFLTPDKDNKMINDIKSIVGQVKEREINNINNVYYIESIKEMGIDIPISPYGTEYDGYITNINNKYYASFDDGKRKVCGYEEELQFSELGLLDKKSDYSISQEDAKFLVRDYLNKKYNEEFEIETLNGNALLYGLGGYDGFSGTAYSKENGKDKTFKFNINNNHIIEDNYYHILVQEEFEELFLETINKVDKHVYIKDFIYPYTYADRKLNKTVSLEEALSRNLLDPTINLITYTNLNEAKINMIEEELNKINFCGNLRIHVFKQNVYNSVKESDNWFAEYYKDTIKEYRYEFEAGKIITKSK